MDPIEIEKFQAMKRCRRRRQVLPSRIQYLVAVLLLSLFTLSPIWLPSLCSSLKLLLFVSLPNMVAVVFAPKCLFFLGNLIIIFLVADSTLSSSSLTPDIYEEYMDKNMSLLRRSLEEDLVEEEEEVKGGGGWEGVGCEDWDEEEKSLFELNKRSEDLIARINEQWRLEARMLNDEKTMYNLSSRWN